MKYRVYLRISKKGLVRASTRPNYQALPGNDYSKPQPTVSIALDLDIDDKEFEATRILLEKKIANLKPAVEVKEATEEELSKGEHK